MDYLCSLLEDKVSGRLVNARSIVFDMYNVPFDEDYWLLLKSKQIGKPIDEIKKMFGIYSYEATRLYDSTINGYLSIMNGNKHNDIPDNIMDYYIKPAISFIKNKYHLLCSDKVAIYDKYDLFIDKIDLYIDSSNKYHLFSYNVSKSMVSLEGNYLYDIINDYNIIEVQRNILSLQKAFIENAYGEDISDIHILWFMKHNVIDMVLPFNNNILNEVKDYVYNSIDEDRRNNTEGSESI